MDWTLLLEQLAQPFPVEAVFWRAGALTRDKKRAQALAYAEPRTYEDVLNRLCPGDWSCVFVPWGESRIICELSVHGVTRSSTGEFEEDKNAFAKGTVAEAQAFKRACSKFGLGRYLYELDTPWVDYDSAKGRLLETPKLPAKFTPQSGKTSVKSPANKAVPSSTANSNEVPTDSPRLSNDRAQGMHKELGKLGITEHYLFAAEVLGREVGSLTELTEVEALEVWRSAKGPLKEAA